MILCWDFRDSGEALAVLRDFRFAGMSGFTSVLFHPRQSQRFRVSHDHGAATGCSTAYFDQSFAKRRVWDQANSHRSIVQRLKRQQFEMPTPRTNRVGRCSYITSPMQKALHDILIERPYLYRCEMAEFLYRRFCKRISERSIGRTLRSIS